jgi:hypothetical protein
MERYYLCHLSTRERLCDVSQALGAGGSEYCKGILAVMRSVVGLWLPKKSDFGAELAGAQATPDTSTSTTCQLSIPISRSSNTHLELYGCRGTGSDDRTQTQARLRFV